MKTNEYRIEFHVPPCTHPHTSDIQRGCLLNISDRKWKCQALDIVAYTYLLKTRTVEPEKQLLLENGSETTFVSRQWSRNRQQNNIRC
jgi:hypothetical protein